MRVFSSICLLFFLNLASVKGQSGTFSIEVESNEVYEGVPFKVTFSIENLNGDFEAPSFNDFEVSMGPMTSQSMSIINGKVSQMASYTYYLVSNKSGSYVIENGYLKTGTETLETEPIKIEVLPNGAGITKNKDNKSTFKTTKEKEDIEKEKNVLPKRPTRKIKKI